MPSRDLKDLEPSFGSTVMRFLFFLEKIHIPVIVTCTYRSESEQDQLYAQGRTDPGNVVTNASGGESPHNCTNDDGEPAALAVDLVFGSHRKVYWRGPWWILGRIATRYFDLEWGGDWRTPDCPHFQMRGWREWAKTKPYVKTSL